MKKNVLLARLLVSVFVIIALMPAAQAFAWGWARSLPSHHTVVVLRGARYHYWGGRFYRRGAIGFFIVTPPIGAVITLLPDGFNTVIVGGIRYYYFDGVYYTDAPTGYVVVPAPAGAPTTVLQQATPAPAETTATPPGQTFTINVPNSSGGFTPVKLVKYKNGWLGPQGEFYPGNPTVDQLSVLYGK